MRLLKHRRLHVNMGPYEHVETSATVEIDTNVDRDLLKEYDVDTNDLDAVTGFMDDHLVQMLLTDVEDAHYLTTETDSFIHEYSKNYKENK